MQKLLLPSLFFACSILSAQITPTDYSLSANWSAGIMKGALDLRLNPSFTIVSPDTLSQSLVTVNYDTASGYDLFCVYPTLILGNDSTPSNQPINITSKASADLALQWFVSEFSQFGRVYAPYYRQTNLVTFSGTTPYAVQAPIFDTALTDVDAAFDYYMRHYNNGKKVILLGYSQGAVLLGMLLRKLEIDTVSEPYLNKIFLSVLIGMESGPFVTQTGLTGGWWQHIPVCQDSTDTACITSWDAHKYGQPLQSLINLVPFDTDFVSLGFMYRNFNPVNQRLFMDHLGFDSVQREARVAIYPKALYQQLTGTDYNVPTDFIGFRDMYYGNISNPNVSDFGYMVERIPNVPNDSRIDPVTLSSTNDLHVLDPYENTGDVICLIYQKMGKPCPASFDTLASVPIDTSPSAINTLSQAQQGFTVFPNPASDYLQLKLPPGNITAIAIYDILGNVIATYERTRTLNIKNLAGGPYIIKVKGGGQVWQQRFIKM